TEYEPDVTVKNADMKLYINGVFKEQMIWKEYDNSTVITHGDMPIRKRSVVIIPHPANRQRATILK
ncbi:MAG: hypothetical protein LBK45_04955, partial [Tannerellaceae bacterium]|nr:hypothetical protein [Tannerellaceae bacterium]